MARMERVAVWSLMMNSAQNVDVFNEASIAWEKRYSAMMARRRAAEAQAFSADAAANSPDSFWDSVRRKAQESAGTSTGSRMYEQAERARRRMQDEGSAGAGTVDAKAAKGIAALAARTARASRAWKTYQDLERSRRSGSLQMTAMSSASSMDDDDVVRVK